MCPPLESPRLELTTFLAVPAGEYTAWCRQNLLLSSSRSDARGWVRQCCGGCLRFKHSRRAGVARAVLSTNSPGFGRNEQSLCCTGESVNRPYGVRKFKIAALS